MSLLFLDSLFFLNSYVKISKIFSTGSIGSACPALFYKRVALFQLVIPHPGLELSAVYFFWIPCSLRNLLLKFQIFSQSDEPVGNQFNRVAWWQPRFINSLHYFSRFSLVRARNLALFVLLDSIFFKESSSNVLDFLSTSLSSWEPIQPVLLGSSSFSVF